MGARSDGGAEHRVDGLPRGMRTDAAEGHTGLLHRGTVRVGRAQEVGASQARVTIGHSVQHHTRERAVCVRQHARERLEATGTLPGFDHPQPGYVQEERHHADGDGGWRIFVSPVESSRVDRCRMRACVHECTIYTGTNL